MTVDIQWNFPYGFILSNKGQSRSEDTNTESGRKESHSQFGLADVAHAAEKELLGWELSTGDAEESPPFEFDPQWNQPPLSFSCFFLWG